MNYALKKTLAFSLWPLVFLLSLQKLKWNFKFVQYMNNHLINRELLSSIQSAFDYFSVLTLTGPRQSGKTTLC